MLCSFRPLAHRTILLGIAPQTKPNVDCIVGSRGPGTNEGDLLLMPHLAEIHPAACGRVCEPIAGYKSNRRANSARGVSAIFG